MSSMSASDAAPLPRLGEVFFDVRGSSRSMRLSWYADTGIAVFSIWQGGTCTGTFRLPMDDLSRLMESLRRGMQGAQDDPPDARAIPSGGQRPRLAIGAAPEPYTGALLALGGAAPLPLPGEADGRGGQADGPVPLPGYGAEPAYLSDYRDQRSQGDGQVPSYGGPPSFGGTAYGDRQGFGETRDHGHVQPAGDAPGAGEAVPSYGSPQGYGGAPAYDAAGYGMPGYTGISHAYGDGGSSRGAPAAYDGQQPAAASHSDLGGPYGMAPSSDGRSYAPEQGFPDARPYTAAALGATGSGANQVPGYPGAAGAEQGYGDAGYDPQGYAIPGYAEQVPAVADYPDGGFGARGYGSPDPATRGYPGAHAYSSPEEYEPSPPRPADDLPSATGYAAPQVPVPLSAPPMPGAGLADTASPERFPLAYRDQPAYPEVAGFPPAPAHARLAGRADQPGYGEQPGYGDQPGYAEQSREQDYQSGGYQLPSPAGPLHSLGAPSPDPLGRDPREGSRPDGPASHGAPADPRASLQDMPASGYPDDQYPRNGYPDGYHLSGPRPGGTDGYLVGRDSGGYSAGGYGSPASGPSFTPNGAPSFTPSEPGALQAYGNGAAAGNGAGYANGNGAYHPDANGYGSGQNGAGYATPGGYGQDGYGQDGYGQNGYSQNGYGNDSGYGNGNGLGYGHQGYRNGSDWYPVSQYPDTPGYGGDAGHEQASGGYPDADRYGPPANGRDAGEQRYPERR